MQPRHRFDIDYGPPPTKGDLAERLKEQSCELQRVQAENAQLRHRIDTLERTTAAAVNLLSHLHGGRNSR
jgi:hypothetical protein